MINPIEWFKQKGFSFDDERITIRDVVELQLDAKEAGIGMSTDLHQAAVALIRNPRDKHCWHNLQNAANRWDADRRGVRNDAIINAESSTPCCDICSGPHETGDCL